MRAQVVLIQGDHVLLARHERAGHTYWVLPGGEVERNETPAAAAVREVREEAGLEIAVERLLFVEQPRVEDEVVIKQPRYTYLGRVVGGTLYSWRDESGGHPEKGYLAGVEWKSWDGTEYDFATRDTLRRVKSALSL